MSGETVIISSLDSLIDDRLFRNFPEASGHSICGEKIIITKNFTNIIIESDGMISESEVAEVKRLKAMRE